MASAKVLACGACLVLAFIYIMTFSYLSDADNHIVASASTWKRILTQSLQQAVKRTPNSSYYSLASVRVSVPRNNTVVCMIITTPRSWNTRARAVLNTWAKRCHIPLFFYSRGAASRGHPIINSTHTVPLDVREGRRHLTSKTLAALRYSLITYGDVADWFLKCDDDTYIVWENLMYVLGEHQSWSEIYLGYHFHTSIPHGFASGGAAYIISKPAVRKLFDNGPKCRNSRIEDVDIGRCLAKFGIYPSRTLGADGRLRFHPHNPTTLLDGNPLHAKWFYFTYGNITIGNQKASNVMSSDAATFHYMTPGQMYMFDYLLYRLNRHL